MFDAFNPGYLGNMDQAVNIVINADKNTKVRDIFNFSFNGGTNGIFLADHVPWIRTDLFHAQRNPPVFRADIQHNRFNDFTGSYHFGRVTDFAGPGHFRNMNQAFNADFNFDKCAVIR